MLIGLLGTVLVAATSGALAHIVGASSLRSVMLALWVWLGILALLASLATSWAFAAWMVGSAAYVLRAVVASRRTDIGQQPQPNS